MRNQSQRGGSDGNDGSGGQESWHKTDTPERALCAPRFSVSVIAFYEKVIKVKADVAAFLINLLSICVTLRWVTWGVVKGAPNRGVHLDP